MSSARALVAGLLAVAGWATLAAPAGAAWSPPRIASFNGSVQGSGFETALSADGRRLVFSTAAFDLLPQPAPPGTYRVGGLVRRDLDSGDVDLVVPGRLFDAVTNEPLGEGGGSTPSLSADGSRVAFVTRDGLVAGDANGRPDVYVRDLTRPWGAPGAVELASAQDGTGEALGWGEPGSGGARLTQAGGTLSGDGRRVVFLTGAAAVLTPGGPELPAGQVVVRDLDARSTRVLTTASGTGTPVGGGRLATLSGDGTAVAWVGEQGPAQARFAAGESLDPALPWVLWRRADGDPAAPAVRPAATGDPDVPGCAAGQPAVPVCAGPLALGFETAGFPAPVGLSRDGLRVAFVSTLRPVGAEQLAEFGQADAFLATVDPGRATATVVRELTREGESSSSIENSSPVVGIGISGDGAAVGFTTARTRFRLSTPVFLGATPTAGVDLETYVADLRADALELVSRGVGDTKALGNSGGSDDIPKLSGDGGRIALTSAARNLVAGDVNGLPDSFLVERATPPAAPPVAAQDVPAVDPGKGPVAAYRLRVSIAARADGSLRVDATLPGPGVLTVDVVRPAARATARRTLVSARRRSSVAGRVSVRMLRPKALARKARPRSVRIDVRARFTPAAGTFTGKRPLSRTIPTLLRIPAQRSAGGAR